MVEKGVKIKKVEKMKMYEKIRKKKIGGEKSRLAIRKAVQPHFASPLVGRHLSSTLLSFSL